MSSETKTVRQRWPTVTVSVGADRLRSLEAAAAAKGFESERGARPGGLVAALLRRLWPWLERQGFDPSRCDISPEHAWMLGEMRSLAEREPQRWAALLAAVEDVTGQPMPAEMRARVHALLPPAAAAKARPRRA